jgi:hypothetical protein
MTCRHYRIADLYLSASHSDGTSISLLEAMACGRPALVSDIPGNREWVQPGVNGWLFPDGDEKALAQAIVRAVDQRQQLPEMGRAAREIAEQRADWERNFQELLKAYGLALEIFRRGLTVHQRFNCDIKTCFIGALLYSSRRSFWLQKALSIMSTQGKSMLILILM